MKLKNIKTKLDKIYSIVGSWNESQVSEIEKEVVLDILRDLYKDILFDENQNTTPIENTETTEPENTEESKFNIDAVVFTPEECEKPEDINAVRRALMNRDIIMSLYGGGTGEISKPATTIDLMDALQDIDFENESEDDSPVLPFPLSSPEAIEPSDKNTDPIGEENRLPEEGSVQTLGEVMGHSKTIGDILSQDASSIKNIASQIASQNGESLHKLIGINDRFLIMKDIFAGNNATYEDAIANLDDFKDMASVLVHMYDNYPHCSNRDGFRLLITMLERKLS